MKHLPANIIIATIALGFSASAMAAEEPAGKARKQQPKERYALGYFLPKTKAAASFSQRLVKCPTAEDPTIRVETHAQILAKTAPDYARLFRLDARAGFLAKRSTDLFLNPDGTIKSVNATVEGQGAAVLVATAKLATFASSFAAGGVPVRGPENPADALPTRCTDAVLGLVRQHDALADNIGKLESRLAASGLTAGETEELSSSRARLDAIEDALTLTSDPLPIDPTSNGTARTRPLNYAEWFSTLSPKDRSNLPGDDGVLLTWKANSQALATITGAAYLNPGDESSAENPDSAVYYRRPVPVFISMVGCTLNPLKAVMRTAGAPSLNPTDDGPTSCRKDVSPSAGPLTTDVSAGFLQLSGLYRLPIGYGGLFGSRTVAAEFGENGAPMSLRYGSSPGAADIASVIDAVTQGGTSLRDAKADALAREAAMLKSRKDIQDLEAALEKQS